MVRNATAVVTHFKHLKPTVWMLGSKLDREMKVSLLRRCWDRMKRTRPRDPRAVSPTHSFFCLLHHFPAVFFLNSGRLSASLTEPCRPLAVGFIQLQRPWEPRVGGKSGSVVFSQPLISPWMRTDEMCFVYNLDADLFALCRFFPEGKMKKKKKERGKWRTSSPA